MLPEFQRNYVWSNTQVLRLVDSIYKGYPIGVILVWEMDRQFVTKYADLLRPMAGLQSDGVGDASYLVIDGQQRLTSLIMLREGQLQLDDGKVRHAKLYFNPLNQELRRARGLELEKKSEWFNLTSILDSSKTIPQIISEKAQAVKDDSLRMNVKVENGLSRLRERFYGYTIPVNKTSLESKEYLALFEEIADIFVRINSSGTKIRITELVMALLTADMRASIGKSFKNDVDVFLENLTKQGWDISVPVFIRVFIAVSHNSGDLSRFSEELRNSQTVSTKDYIEWLRCTKESLVRTVELLKGLGIDKSDWLPSSYVLVPMAYYIFKESIQKGTNLAPSSLRGLEKWFVTASFWARYSASLDTWIKEDIDTLSHGNSPDALAKNVGRYEADEESLSGELTLARQVLLYLTLKHLRAWDWDTKNSPLRPIDKLPISSLQAHHIFPRNYISKVASKDEDVHELVNDIANITLISPSANEQIGDSKPSEYLKTLKDRDPSFLVGHCVPVDEVLWTHERYRDFLGERRKSLVKSANSYLGSIAQ